MILDIKKKKYFFVQPFYDPKYALWKYTYKIRYYKNFENAFSAYKKEFGIYEHALIRWSEDKMFVLETMLSEEDFESLRIQKVTYMMSIASYKDLLVYYLRKDVDSNVFLVHKPILGFHNKKDLVYIFFGEVEYVRLVDVY
ncbi:hypothetical protein PGDDIFCJ_00100 [Thermus phage YS40_Isch]|nr:hypothetical protein PGDDIFCJ_00100 [Thermus phage YS40_Isch]